MGADVTQQAVQAGMVDEIRLQLAPVTLGSGTRLFAGREHHTFECVDARVSSHVTHLRFRTLSRPPPPLA
jgi:dihydrofolate reductase